MSADRIESFLNQVLDRRDFLKTAGLVGGGLVGTSMLGSLMWENIEANRATVRSYGKYLKPVNSQEFTFSDEPLIAHIKLLQHVTAYLIGGDSPAEVLLRRGPHLDTSLNRESFDTVSVAYGIPVFGEAFSSKDNKKGVIYISVDNRLLKGGQWLMFADKSGNPVDPQGQKLPREEKPFYTSNPFVILP